MHATLGLRLCLILSNLRRSELLLLFVACHVRIAEVAAVLRCGHGSGNSRENARNFAMLCERESECEAMVATVLLNLWPFAASFDG